METICCYLKLTKMDILKSVFDNPIIKNLAFSKIKKVMAENNIKAIIVTIDDNGDIQAEATTAEQKTIPLNDYNTYLQSHLKQLANGTT